MSTGAILNQKPITVTNASEIEYSNTTSQLTATNVQAAIDEVVEKFSGKISVNGTLKQGIASENIEEGSFVVEGGSWTDVSILNDEVTSRYSSLGAYELSNGNFIYFASCEPSSGNQYQLGYIIFDKNLQVIQELTKLSIGTLSYVNLINIAKINTDRFIVTFGEHSGGAGTRTYQARIIDVNNNVVSLSNKLSLSKSYNASNQYSYSYPYGLGNDYFIYINAVNTAGGMNLTVMKYTGNSFIASNGYNISGLIISNNANVVEWGNNQFSLYVGDNTETPNFPTFSYSVTEDSITLTQLKSQHLDLGYTGRLKHAIYPISNELAIIFYLKTSETNTFKYRFIQYDHSSGTATPLEENEIVGRFFGLNDQDYYVADKLIDNNIFFVDNNYFLSVVIHPETKTLDYILYEKDMPLFKNSSNLYYPFYYLHANTTSESNYIVTGDVNSRISAMFIYPDKLFISITTTTISGISAEGKNTNEVINYYVPN